MNRSHGIINHRKRICGRKGRKTMKQNLVWEKQILDETNDLFLLRYMILMQMSFSGTPLYGIAIEKMQNDAIIEREAIEGISETEQEAVVFLQQLYEGNTFPSALAELVDDYISAKDWGEIAC